MIAVHRLNVGRLFDSITIESNGLRYSQFPIVIWHITLSFLVKA
jgi:hypothetical protein